MFTYFDISFHFRTDVLGLSNYLGPLVFYIEQRTIDEAVEVYDLMMYCIDLTGALSLSCWGMYSQKLMGFRGSNVRNPRLL